MLLCSIAPHTFKRKLRSICQKCKSTRAEKNSTKKRQKSKKEENRVLCKQAYRPFLNWFFLFYWFSVRWTAKNVCECVMRNNNTSYISDNNKGDQRTWNKRSGSRCALTAMHCLTRSETLNSFTHTMYDVCGGIYTLTAAHTPSLGQFYGQHLSVQIYLCVIHPKCILWIYLNSLLTWHKRRFVNFQAFYWTWVHFATHIANRFEIGCWQRKTSSEHSEQIGAISFHSVPLKFKQTDE